MAHIQHHYSTTSISTMGTGQELDNSMDMEHEDNFRSERYKVLHDPIHRHMVLPDTVLKCVDTPQFQRLRDLKQLGTVYYVFPGASHNRFEHSIGVSFLSGNMIDHLAMINPELDITNEEKLCIRVAGAVHDLGHGPLSHVFDGLFIPSVCGKDEHWSHEDMSLDLFDLMLDDNGIEDLDFGDCRKMVKQMVMGIKTPKPGLGTAAATTILSSTRIQERPFLFEIVANGKNGIDTDKFDYLARDTYNVGMSTSFDYRRLLYGSRILSYVG